MTYYQQLNVSPDASVQQIKEAYPHLPDGAIPAALAFAAEALKADVVYPLPLQMA